MATPTIIKLGIKALLLGPAAYVILSTASLINSETFLKIGSQARLEQLLEQEKKKLNCAREIKAELFAHPTPYATKNKDGTYHITLNGNLATEPILKHELYHICDGHVDSGDSALKYLLWEEPQAMLYETFGLEL